jgi:hypothetical protein
MTTPDLQAVVTRLETLERQNRRLKQVGAAALLLIGLGLVMGGQNPAKSKMMEGERFSLRDAKGKERGWFGMGSDGPALRFLDDSGEERAGLTMSRDGLILRLAGTNGVLQSGLSVERMGVAVVALDENGNPLVGVNAIKNNTGILIPAQGRPKPPGP